MAAQAARKQIIHIYKSAIDINKFENDGNTHKSKIIIMPVIVKANTCQTKWKRACPVQSGLVAWDSLKSTNKGITDNPNATAAKSIFAKKDGDNLEKQSQI